MQRKLMKTLSGALCAAAVSSFMLASPVDAEIAVRISPPSWFIGTATPYYYQGRASYWYENRWYYRDGRHWRYYEREPYELSKHHGHSHRHYGRRHWRGFHRR
jgi:hypothetical protein